MKTLSIICLTLIATVSAWAQKQQAIGYSQTNVDFSKYKTFTWAKSEKTTANANGGYDIYYYEIDQPVDKHPKKSKNKSAKVNATEPYVYTYGVIIPAKDEGANGIIQDAINNELEGRGYVANANGADLIVAYQVLEHKAKLHGYNNDYPDVVQGKQVRTAADTATFELQPGSLIVTLVDARTSRVVWDGYSTNMMNNNAYINDEVALKEEVHNIFEEFKYSADKARRNN